MCFFFLMLRRPPRSTLFPTRRSSDLLPGFQKEWAPRFPPFSTLGVLGIVFVAMALKADDLLARVEKEIGRAHVLNSSHVRISYAVFCLKKKNTINSSSSQDAFLSDHT